MIFPRAAIVLFFLPRSETLFRAVLANRELLNFQRLTLELPTGISSHFFNSSQTVLPYYSQNQAGEISSLYDEKADGSQRSPRNGLLLFWLLILTSMGPSHVS